ncbi:hypothetical protein KAI87_00245 [Myxococcota bacterium]|nr:hypothetical protein [Myxococcota bacterium]
MTKIEYPTQRATHIYNPTPIENESDSAESGVLIPRDKKFAKQVDDLEISPTRQVRHARYHREDVPYHVVNRIYWGAFRLVPTPKTTAIINGVFAKAREQFPNIKLYAAVTMSNHQHWQCQGHPAELPRFIGYIKREITRRLNFAQEKFGPMWASYDSLALPGQISELSSLRYILSQGVKEGLVERPEDWPGQHCAKSLLTGEPLRGIWFDGTSYSRDRDREKRRVGGNPDKIKRENYIEETEFYFDPLPRWEHLSQADYQTKIRHIVNEIVSKEAKERGDAPVLGAQAVMQMSIETRKAWVPLPHHEGRKRLICWGPSYAPELQDYLEEYWAFQLAYKEISKRFRAGELNVQFPQNAYRPSTYAGPPDWGPEQRKTAA